MSKNHAAATGAVIRLRTVVIGVLVVSLCMILPLTLVWRQVYLSNASLTVKRYNDSLSTLNRDIERLRLVAATLADNGRIENIARAQIGLVYPASSRIVLIKKRSEASRGKPVFGRELEFFAILRRSIFGDRG